MSAELVLGKAAYLPIRTMKDFDATVDPLSSVLGVMSKILPNEQILVQINLSGASSGWASAAKSLLNPPKVEGQTSVKPSNAGIIEEKIALPGFTSAIRLLVAAPTEPQAKALIDSVAGSFGSYANGDGNSLRLSKPNNRKKKKFIDAIYARTSDQSPAGQVLSTKEIASLWHLPSKTLSTLPNLSWAHQSCLIRQKIFRQQKVQKETQSITLVVQYTKIRSKPLELSILIGVDISM